MPREKRQGDAGERVEALQMHGGLGAGYRIAMRDLEIRGAGNLLGTEQSGHVAVIGFELYCRLLRSAVSRMKKGVASSARCATSFGFPDFTGGRGGGWNGRSLCASRIYSGGQGKD